MDRLPLTTRADTSGIPSLDGLCLGGALMVALYHVAHYYVKLGGPAAFEAAHGDPLGGMLLRCDAGVMLLALAGGFALGRPLAERRLAGLPGESWWAFVRRETALRYPLYALVLTVFLVCLLWVVRVRFAELAPHFVAGLLAIHGAAFGYENPINTSAWLVEAELQFVLVAPLLGSVFGLGGTVARRATLAGIALGSAAALH
ncbi:MAG TPA: hypothetical protein VFK09_00560, partial [Gemmatimonadales bacterium]|nr:hypothetical protein [Gemmatimonadales bacterium]